MLTWKFKSSYSDTLVPHKCLICKIWANENIKNHGRLAENFRFLLDSQLQMLHIALHAASMWSWILHWRISLIMLGKTRSQGIIIPPDFCPAKQHLKYLWKFCYCCLSLLLSWPAWVKHAQGQNSVHMWSRRSSITTLTKTVNMSLSWHCLEVRWMGKDKLMACSDVAALLMLSIAMNHVEACR